MPARALDYSGRDRPAGRECLVVAQVLRVVGQVAHARLHAGSPVIGQPARIGLRGDRLGDMPGPAGQHRQRLDGYPVLSGRIIPGMEAPRGGPQVLLLSTGPRPALIDVIDDREDRVLSSLLLSYPRGFSDEKKERGSWPIAWRCGLRTGIAPGQWSMRRMRRSGRLRSGCCSRCWPRAGEGMRLGEVLGMAISDFVMGRGHCLYRGRPAGGQPEPGAREDDAPAPHLRQRGPGTAVR